MIILGHRAADSRIRREGRHRVDDWHRPVGGRRRAFSARLHGACGRRATTLLLSSASANTARAAELARDLAGSSVPARCCLQPEWEQRGTRPDVPITGRGHGQSPLDCAARARAPDALGSRRAIG